MLSGGVGSRLLILFLELYNRIHMTMVTKIVAQACICDPNPFGKFKNVLISLISNSSPIMYSPMKSEIKN
jgi:hypothetical protein